MAGLLPMVFHQPPIWLAATNDIIHKDLGHLALDLSLPHIIFLLRHQLQQPLRIGKGYLVSSLNRPSYMHIFNVV